MKKLVVPLAVAISLCFAVVAIFYSNAGVNYIEQEKWTVADIPKLEERSVEVSIMLNGMNGPLNRIPLSRLPPNRSVVPVVIDLPGCAHLTSTEFIPRHIAVIAAGERTVTGRWARLEACSSGNGKILTKIIENELAISLKVIESTPWLDDEKIVIRGYGEAAPIIAAYSGRSVGRIINGEPCLTDWTGISKASPLTILLTTSASGVTLDRTTNPAYTCPAKQRPNFSNNVKVVIASGRMTPATRPLLLAEAEKEALAIALGLDRGD